MKIKINDPQIIWMTRLVNKDLKIDETVPAGDRSFCSVVEKESQGHCVGGILSETGKIYTSDRQ